MFSVGSRGRHGENRQSGVFFAVSFCGFPTNQPAGRIGEQNDILNNVWQHDGSVCTFVRLLFTLCTGRDRASFLRRMVEKSECGENIGAEIREICWTLKPREELIEMALNKKSKQTG